MAPESTWLLVVAVEKQHPKPDPEGLAEMVSPDIPSGVEGDSDPELKREIRGPLRSLGKGLKHRSWVEAGFAGQEQRLWEELL